MGSSVSTIDLTNLDGAFMWFEDAVTWSVQFEVGVSGRLDIDQLKSALAGAIKVHPLAGARLGPPHPKRRQWHLPTTPAAIDCPVVECRDDVDTALADLRTDFYSSAPDLDGEPAFTVTVARQPDADLILFNFHHIAFDGMSAARFAASVARAYAGAPDPQHGPDLPTARDLRALVGKRSMREVLRWLKQAAADNKIKKAGIQSIAADGGQAESSSFGYVTRRLTTQQSAEISTFRLDGATINDILLAALMLTIRAWNAGHDASITGRPSVLVPTNLRPETWRTEVISNLVSFFGVSLPAHAATLPEAIAEVRSQTQRIKADRAAGMLIHVLNIIDKVPTAIMKRMKAEIPSDPKDLESSVLSNLGALSMPGFGEGLEITDIWFSPPTFGPMPLVVGACTVDGELRLTFRYLRERLSPEAAEQFASQYVATLGVTCLS